MAGMFASRCLALLAVLVVLLDLSARPPYVQAQDDVEVTTESAEGAAAEPAKEADAAAGEGEAVDEEKSQQFVDSAKELQEKLAQLKALLDAKGDADPGLKEKLAGLESQLSGLGLDGLTGGAANPELTEFLGGCVAMSMRRLGMHKSSTLGALRKLSEGKLPPEEAAKNELWRMVGVCVSEFKADEYADFKSGKTKMLPKTYVEQSKKPEAEAKVMEIEAQNWEELKRISAGLLQELTGGDGEKPPFNAGLLAFIPLLVVAGFLGKMYLDNQKDKDLKSSKKKKRDGPPSSEKDKPTTSKSGGSATKRDTTPARTPAD